MFFLYNRAGKPDGLCAGAPADAGGGVRCPRPPGGPRHRPRHDHTPGAIHHRRHVALPLSM
jgi:hypothetical protein